MGDLVDEVGLKWLGQSSFKIKSENKIIYIDPFQLKGKPEKADLILITHEHYDHCSPDDIAKIIKDDTKIIAPNHCKIKGDVQVVRPNQNLNVEGIQVETVYAYNVDKTAHPKGDGVGYIITVNGKRIYHAGDTDLIAEMNVIENIDIALLPVGGTFTMDAIEAAQAANIIQPQLAIPMHYGSVVGSDADAELFKKKCEIEVEILEREG
jgi:L-ascorbate metabolism protein UlaG (beta-lactamase superfamily)